MLRAALMVLGLLLVVPGQPASAAARSPGAALRLVRVTAAPGAIRAEVRASGIGGRAVVVAASVRGRQVARAKRLPARRVTVRLRVGTAGGRATVCVDPGRHVRERVERDNCRSVMLAPAAASPAPAAPPAEPSSASAPSAPTPKPAPEPLVAPVTAGPVTTPALASPLPTPDRAVPLGAALWWGCAERGAFVGPPALACPRPDDPRYEQTAERFDSVTPENELKELWIHPGPGRWDFRVPDRLMAWAAARGKAVRGHTLLYGDAVPNWKDKAAWTPETLRAELREHVTTVVERYRGRVAEWDVVNEAFEDDGSAARNVYSRVLGPGHVEEAFRAARAADPGAKLFYNEYNADRPGSPRAEAVHRMATDFVVRGVPLDGIGLQLHAGTGGGHPTREELRRQFERYALLGLEVQITEADVATRAPEDLAEQARVYREAGEACAAAPNCTRFTVWGVADHHSWRGLDQRPLLFDDEFAPKPAWAALGEALRRPAAEPPATAETPTAPAG